MLGQEAKAFKNPDIKKMLKETCTETTRKRGVVQM